MHWGGCRGHLTSLRMQITPKQNILQCVQLFWFKGLLKSLNFLERKPGSWKWGDKKMGGKLPTKWEIVAQWFGQNGSHALRAERWEGTECRVLCSGIPIGVPDQSSNWSSDESAVEESWVEQCSELRVRWRWSGAGHSILEIKMPAANRCLQSLFKTSVCGVLCLHWLQRLHSVHHSPNSHLEKLLPMLSLSDHTSGRITALNMTWDKGLTTSQLITSHGLHGITSLEVEA